jgi:hypothetical protein
LGSKTRWFITSTCLKPFSDELHKSVKLLSFVNRSLSYLVIEENAMMRFSIPLAGFAALFVMSGEAEAISRYVTTSMSCDAVQSRVAGEGAAILRYQSTRNPSLPLYGRYVSDNRFCEYGEVSVPAYVPTNDVRSCRVNKCERPDYDDWWRRR